MQNAALPSLRPLFMLAASTLVLAAQEKPAAPEKLKPVVIKGTAIGGEVTPVTPTLVLSAKALEGLPQSNIGDLLADLPGVASSYFGPNSGRPIVRGLDGDRLKITQNGVNSLDASSSSPDHAVSVDPLAIREAQILRGPAALLYSNSILGGVINLVDARIPDQRLAQRQSVVGRMGSVDGLRSAGVLAEGSAGAFAYHFDGFDKSTRDLLTPVGRIADTSADNRGAATGMLVGGLSALASISLTSVSDVAVAKAKKLTDAAELAAYWADHPLAKGIADFWVAHPLARILCEQPAIWAVPLSILLMIFVSKATAASVPADIRMKMLVLHAPEALGLKQELSLIHI